MERKYYRVNYYSKGLDVKDIKRIIARLQEKFPDVKKRWVKAFGDDFENGYKKLVTTGIFLNDDHVDEYMQNIREEFENVNKIFTSNGYDPLFNDIKMLYKSWQFRDKLIEYLPESVLNAEFGCMTFEEHVSPLVSDKSKQHEQEGPTPNS